MVIPGEVGYNINYYAVKLTSFTDSASVGLTLADFNGLQLTGQTSGVVAKVINFVATDALTLILYMYNMKILVQIIHL